MFGGTTDAGHEGAVLYDSGAGAYEELKQGPLGPRAIPSLDGGPNEGTSPRSPI